MLPFYVKDENALMKGEPMEGNNGKGTVLS